MEYFQYDLIYEIKTGRDFRVLNLVISGIPSIQAHVIGSLEILQVLNLVISGIPSIQKS